MKTISKFILAVTLILAHPLSNSVQSTAQEMQKRAHLKPKPNVLVKTLPQRVFYRPVGAATLDKHALKLLQSNTLFWKQAPRHGLNSSGLNLIGINKANSGAQVAGAISILLDRDARFGTKNTSKWSDEKSNLGPSFSTSARWKDIDLESIKLTSFEPLLRPHGTVRVYHRTFLPTAKNLGLLSGIVSAIAVHDVAKNRVKEVLALKGMELDKSHVAAILLDYELKAMAIKSSVDIPNFEPVMFYGKGTKFVHVIGATNPQHSSQELSWQFVSVSRTKIKDYLKSGALSTGPISNAVRKMLSGSDEAQIPLLQFDIDSATSKRKGGRNIVVIPVFEPYGRPSSSLPKPIPKPGSGSTNN